MPSQPGLRLYRTVPDGILQHREVLFVDGRRRPRRSRRRPGRTGRWIRDRRRWRSGRPSGRAPGPGSSRRSRRTRPCPLGAASLDDRRALPVAQLPHVEVAVLAVDAAWPAACRGRCRRWPASGAARRPPARPWCAYSLAPAYSSSTDGLRLLGLQEQRVAVVAADHQQDPGPGADAAHADDLAGHVHEPVLTEQVPAIGWQRPAVAPRPAPASRCEEPVRRGVRASDPRPAPRAAAVAMMRRSPSTTAESLSSACMLSRVRAFATAASVRLTCVAAARLAALEQVVDVQLGVPDLEVGLRRRSRAWPCGRRRPRRSPPGGAACR